MIEFLRGKGYGYGSGSLSPDCKTFLLNIPKNASSYMIDWARHYGWSSAVVGDECDWHRVEEMVVVIRDPLDRWVSGIAQYISSYILNVDGPNGPIFPGDKINGRYDYAMPFNQFIDSYNQTVERLIFDVICRFDDHVWPQIEFFENLLPSIPRKFFYIDNSFDYKIRTHLGFDVIQGLDRNDGGALPIKRFFKERLEHRPELKDRIKRAYARDYQLISEVFDDR